MTWITDNTGTYWHEIPPRKRRKPARALRFAEIKVGDQLVLKPSKSWHRKIPQYFVVTDLWFDPVAGQRDEVSGHMVAIRVIRHDGEVHGSKRPHTRRGLASQQYHYAGIDYIAQCKALVASIDNGVVVGIGRGKLIRGRPKMPGGGL